MTRLLYVLNDSRFFMSHRVGLAQAAQAAGYEVHVATPDEAVRAEIEALGFQWHRFGLSRAGLHLFQEIQSIRALTRLYKKVQPDLVHHLTIKPVIYGSIAARLAKVPAVVNAMTGLGYVFTEKTWRARVLRMMIQPLARFALQFNHSRLIFQNPDDEQVFISRGLTRADHCVVIKSSGVDVDEVQMTEEVDAEAVKIIFAGRMLWSKGVADFVGAARRLHRAGCTARFILVGDTDPGNPAAVPQAQLHAWNDEGCVEWWGWREDLIEIYQKAHIACLPSYREGVPKALLEAGACGRPIVTTDAPGCKETVIEGENGFIVPPGNHIALADKLLLLINDAALRQQMGRASRAFICREFSQAYVAQQTLALYQQQVDQWVPVHKAQCV